MTALSGPQALSTTAPQFSNLLHASVRFCRHYVILGTILLAAVSMVYVELPVLSPSPQIFPAFLPGFYDDLRVGSSVRLEHRDCIMHALVPCIHLLRYSEMTTRAGDPESHEDEKRAMTTIEPAVKTQYGLKEKGGSGHKYPHTPCEHPFQIIGFQYLSDIMQTNHAWIWSDLSRNYDPNLSFVLRIPVGCPAGLCLLIVRGIF